MTTPPRVRVVCTSAARLRTSLWCLVFTICATFTLTAAPADPHQQARLLMAEAQQTTNPVRLYMLALDIDEALQKAIKSKPDDPEVLLDAVRFYTKSPTIAAGSVERAKRFAKKLATLDPPLGHFAAGYIAYHEKQFGVARRELKEAVRTIGGPNRNLALRWLGWLSQESQQYADAFAAWEQLRPADPKALYEIARTASFCGCEREKGKAALEEYRKLRPKDDDARKLAEKFK